MPPDIAVALGVLALVCVLIALAAIAGRLSARLFMDEAEVPEPARHESRHRP